MTNQPTTDTYQLSQSTIDRLIPIGENTVEQVESRYPARQLASGTEVTRVAPSPTGMMHIGVLYASLISERIAHRSGGVFILRIEDTDRKREVEGARDFIVRSLKDFGITPDEGVDENDTEKGLYGPYTQSHRRKIYQTYVRQLLDTGQAYPCFATPEELESIITSQKSTKNRPGYYGQWAIWRDRPETEVIAALDSGKPFVVRFRSSGNITKRRTIQDLARGRLELPENDNDIVILKQDGLPTYHFAHAIDDTLMQTTLAIRGDEWLPSTSLHVQLCEALGFEPFRYAHIAPIQKTEGDSRRKLSKRKDPEASVSYYTERGYLPKTVIEYLLNQANSSFESWRVENPDASYTEFPFSVENLARSGGLFSIEKLDSIGAEHIAQLSASELYSHIVDWAVKHDTNFHSIITSNPDYAVSALAIERDGEQPRKDMRHLSESPFQYGYFFDEIYDNIQLDKNAQDKLSRIAIEDRQAIVEGFLTTYDPSDSNDEWFAKIKLVGEPLGFTPIMKQFRKHPEQFKGSVADVAMVLRVALTKRNQTPNLCDIMKVMGVDRTTKRLRDFVA